jgi:hypothetical protein
MEAHMSKRNRIPATAIKLTEYQALEDFATKFVASLLNLVGVVGNAGLRKSRTFVNVLERSAQPYCYIKGHVRPFSLYQELYHHRDQLVIIDDADTLFADRTSVPLLKSVLETEENKIVSWNSKAADREGIPRSFVTCSKVTVLCNEWRTVNENMLAVVDRGLFIHFAPSVSEVHAKVAEAGWFADDEVYRFIEQHLHLIVEPSMRYYVKASEMRRAGMEDWQRHTLQMLNGDMERLAIVRRLLDDTSIISEAERVAKYIELTGCSQATFYRDRDMLLGARGDAA